ncbi:MAG: sigma-70 family RNA polymerase sigma factor [Hyphomicrobiaceae bacterium]|nr:sigma-70 family RNA polymerase sigma factor [Hyphomicrobiaceae bacterium]
MSGAFGKSSDKKLIERIANADKAAVQALFARYHVRIYRFIMRMVGSEAVAKTLANEVFLDVWRQAGRFESRSAVSTWLMALARTKAVYWLRNKKKAALADEARFLITDQSALVPKTDKGSDRGSDRGSDISRTIDRLSPDHKAVIDLAYYHELSVREVAKVLEIPARLVKTRMFQARKTLAEKLREAGIERSWP